MAVPNIFGSATSAIPLSQLDTNFATAITLGNTAVYLGNTTTSLGNVTLTNVTISSGNVTLTGANVSGTANISTLIVTGNQTSLGNVAITGNISANIVTVAAGAVGTPSITTTGDTNTGIFFPAADTIAFSEGGVEAMRIDSSGNVGIGTASPTAKVDNTGTFRTTGVTDPTSGAGLELSYRSTYGDVLAYDRTSSAFAELQVRGAPIIFGNAGGERMRINASGNLLVGTTSTFGGASNNFRRTGAGQIISVVTSITSGTNDMMAFVDGDENICGSIQANTTANTVSYVTSSDYRLKDNIQLMTGGLTKVMQLKPSTWNWKSAPEVSGQGFIAHELQAIVPDAVCGVKDELYADGNPKFQGIDTSFLVATLTAAIQEQQTLIQSLTARITALESN